MSPLRPDRRAVLRAGGIAVALPALASLSPRARAAEAPAPRRFVTFFTGNGHPAGRWRPGGGELTFNLSSIMKPLAPHRSDLIVLEGLSLRSSRTTGHAGVGALLTGTRPGQGVSLDQALARGATTRLPSLELGVMVTTPAHPLASPYLSYRAPGAPLRPDDEPDRVYRRLFAAGADTAEVARIARKRQSVLDAVSQSLKKLRARVDATDRRVLDAHAEGIRELERRVPLLPLAGAACARMYAPPNASPRDEAQLARIRDTQIDLLALALACDQTRVATLVIGGPDAPLGFPFLPLGAARASWSELSDRRDEASAAAHARISLWCAEGLARLIAALKAMPERQGTVFDSTAILWATECNADHSHDDVPMLLAGSAGRQLRTGRYLKYPAGTAHNALLVSLLQAMGRTERTFGDPELGAGPLPDLT